MPLNDTLLEDDDLEADSQELVQPRRRERLGSDVRRPARPRILELSPEAELQLKELANSSSSFKAEPAEQPKPPKPLGLMGTIKEGAKGTLRALGATADTMQGDAQGVVQAAQEQSAAPKDPDLARFHAHIEERKQALGDNPSLWEGIKAVGGAAIDNPRGFGLMIAEQLPNSGVALGAGAAGAAAGSLAGPVGTVIGGLAGLASANIGLETGSKALEAAQDSEFTPEEQSRVRREGLVKGGVITGVDAATLGVTKFITNASRRAVERATIKTLTDNGVDVTNAAARRAAMETPEIAESVKAAQELAKEGANKLGKRLATTGGAVALETIGEGAGEYLGELAATGKANAVDAVVEGFAGLGTSIGEIAATGALNRKGLNRLLDSQEEAEKTAEKETEETGVEHEAIPHPKEPEKFVAVPKARSVSGIELERDEEGNLKPVAPVSTQADFNLANRPGFEHTAEDKIRERELEKARTPLIIPGATPPGPTIAGNPASQMTNSALVYTVSRGSARAQKIATDELAKREKEGVDLAVDHAPEKPADTVKRIVATGSEKAQETAKKAEVIVPPTPKVDKAADAVKTPIAPKPETKKPEKIIVPERTKDEISSIKPFEPDFPTIEKKIADAVSNRKNDPNDLMGASQLYRAAIDAQEQLRNSADTKKIERAKEIFTRLEKSVSKLDSSSNRTGPSQKTANALSRGDVEARLIEINKKWGSSQHGKRWKPSTPTSIRSEAENLQAMLTKGNRNYIPTENESKGSTSNISKEDQQVKKEAAPPPKPEEAPKPTATPAPIRQHLDDLIKRRAASKETGKERSVNSAIARAKEVMEGKRTDTALESKWFRMQAAAVRKVDPDTADILSKISEEIKAKPTFSRSKNTKPKSLERKNVESVIKDITGMWKNAPDVVIVDDMNDPVIPESVRAENQRQLSQGATGEPEGFIADGKVYVVASQMNTPADVVRVLLHESLGHFGLRGVFGQELNTILKQVAALRRKDVDAKAKQYGLDPNKESDRLISAEEVLAEMAQANPKNGLVQRAFAVIRKWLRQNIPGFQNLRLSDGEIIEGILIPAQRFVHTGGKTAGGSASFSRNSSAFKKWFRNSKVVDKSGNPLIVYHGTAADIDSFQGSGMDNAIFFTPDPSRANEYSQHGQTGDAPNIVPVYLSLQNPNTVDVSGLRGIDLQRKQDIEITRASMADKDGVIFTNSADSPNLSSSTGESTVYVVFNPTQIKSSTGNSGTFDPTNPDIRFSRSSSPAAAAFRDRFEKITDSLIYNFQDRFKPLKDIQKRAGPVSEDADAALAEERYSGMVRARMDTFEEQMRDPLLKAIHDSKVAYEDVEAYLHALHAPSRNAAMREINPTELELKAQISSLEKQRDSLSNDADVKRFLKERRDLRQAEADIEDGIADESLARMIKQELAQLRKIPNVKDYMESLDKLKALRLVKPFQGDNTALSGMSDKQAKDILDKADKNGTRKALDRVSSIIDAITSRTRQIYVEGGLEKADAIDAWNNKYEHYVPLHRDEVSGNTMPKVGQGFNIRGKESKRATGSNKAVTDILAHVVAQHEAAIIRSEKARVDRALFQFAKTHPDPSLWTLDNAPMLRTVDPVSGFVVERVNPTYKNRPEVLTLKIDGEEHTITFNEQNQEAMRLVASMKNLSSQELGEVTQMVGKFTRFLATMNTTANPVFVARNFLRDLQTAYVNLSDTAIAGKKQEVFRDIPAAIKGMWNLSRGKHKSQWAKYAEEFKAAGGQTGWMEHYKDIGTRADALKKELAAMQPGKLNSGKRAFKSLRDLIEDANNAVENGARLSAYVNARRSGLSEGKAASLAKNLTVNFNARGAKSVELNAWYMFMNASIQGSARLIKALSNREVRKIVAGVIISGFVMDILARSMAGDDDEDGENDYDQLPGHTKAMNFVFMVDGQPVTIPMPYGYNFFASTGRKISEMFFRENYSPVKSATDLAAVFLDAFSPTGQAGSALQYVAPTVADPFVQWAENRNFAGNPLRRDQNPFGVPKPEYQMSFKSTSAPAKWLAEALNNETGGNEVRPGFVNVNPAFFDFAVSSILGGAGRTFLQTASAPAKVAGDGDIQGREIPFVNIFVGARPEYQTERKYFEAAKEVELADKELKTYRQKGDMEMVRQIREEHKEALRLVEAAKTTKNILARLRKRELALDKEDPPNKAQLRKELEEKKREVMSRFNKRYREAIAAE